MKKIDCGSMIVGALGVLIVLSTTTSPFHTIALYLIFPLSIFIMQYNQLLYDTINKRVSNV